MPRATYKKVIVTDELVAQINPKNKELVSLFLEDKGNNSSLETIKAYQSDANIFFVWNLLHNENRLFTEIKKMELIRFFSFASKELQWGSSRSNRMRSFISSLSEFIERVLDEEYPDFHSVVLRAVRSIPKDQRREKTILTDEQVQDLLDHFSEKDAQIACWLALAVFSGSRFSELLRFTVDNIDPDNTAFENLFLETRRSIKTKGRGKNGKMLYKYILRDKFLPYYNRWLEQRKEIMERKGQNHMSLFIRDDGTPAVSGTARSWSNTIDRYLGTPFYPHATRHYLCTELSRKRIPPLFIQNLFGWSTADMVNLYNDLTVKDMVWTELSALKNKQIAIG